MAIDWLILEKIQQIFGSGFCDWFMPRITVLGNAGIIWIIIGVAMLISKKYRKYGVLVLAGLLIGLIIGNGKDYSFPSGHTQASYIATTIITLTNKKFGWVVIPLTILIAFSRMYLYVHFPSDILGGAVLGITIGALTYVYGTKILKIKKE